MSIQEKVNSALANGQLVPEFLEEKRLLDPSHPSAREFSSTMERVHDRLLEGLLGKGFDKGPQKVRFMLQADDEANAFIYTSAKPPVIGFSTGLIEMCANESELAAALSHELGHDYFRQKLGPHVNGKLEELGSDLRGPYILRKASYPQTAMRTLISKFPDENAIQRVFSAMGSKHPNKATRVSALQTAERALVRGKYGMGEQTAASINDAAIAPKLKEMCRSVTFTSYIDGLLANRGYETASVERKMMMLGDLISKDMVGNDAYFESRVKDVAKRLIALPSHVTKTHAFRELVDTVIEHGDREDAYYRTLQKLSGTNMFGLKPLGGLADLDAAIVRFIEAREPAAIQTAASQIVGLANHYLPKNTSLVERVSYSGFDRFKYEHVVAASSSRPLAPSWDAHVRAAVQTGNKDIVQALGHLGITHDPRLQPLLPERGEPVELSRVIMTVYNSAERDSDKSRSKQVHFDAQGQIIGCRDLGHASLYAEEVALQTQALATRIAREKEALAHVSWAELETDFEGFTKKYSEHLIAPIGIVSGQHPFAEAFVKHCELLIKKDPKKYRLLVHEYFTAPGYANKGFRDSSKLMSRELATNSLKVNNRGNGIAADHPFVKFMLEDSHQIFSTEERSKLLGEVRYFNLDPSRPASVAERWLIDPELIMPKAAPKTIAELEAWPGKLQSAYPVEALKHNEAFFTDLIQFETLRTLAHVKTPPTLAELQMIRELASFNPHVEPYIGEGLQQHLKQLGEQYAGSAKPAAALNELVHEFQVSASERVQTGYVAPLFVEHPQLRVQYQEALTTAIDAVVDPAQKAKALEKLVFRSEISGAHRPLLQTLATRASSYQKYVAMVYDGSLADPSFREWAVKSYALSMAKVLGPDDGSAAYVQKFTAAIDRVAAEAPPSNAITILSRLGTKECGNVLLFGSQVGDVLKAKLEQIGIKNLVKHNFHAAVGETVLETIGKNDKTREATIDFLTKPFDRDRCEQFITKMEAEITDSERKKFLAKDLSQAAKLEQMELLHKNFWGLPFEGRVLATKQILFDAAKHEDEVKGIESSVQLVLDKVMAPGSGTADEVRYGRQVVESYLAASHNLEDKRIITSAMLVANKPNGATAGEKLAVGKGLNLVLSSIDPAGDKVKQAIESHTATPENIRTEFKDAKTAAKDPSRSEWLGWVEESNKHVGPAQRIKAGSVLGSGSYGFTVEGIRADGSKVARTILYPHVREKAENEFGILGEAAAIQVRKSKKFAPITDMIRQAHRMSGIETDMDIAAKQGEVFGQLYNGMKVTADGKTLTFSAANYLGHGPDHKDFEIIEGLHFNDIAKAATTAQEKAHVSWLAKTHLTAELHNILSGGAFDHDRHGGQQKILGFHSGQFDAGAATITEMSAREKQLIGYVMGGTLKNHYIKGASIADALHQQIDLCATTEAERDFLAAVERGVLALGDYQKHLPSDVLGNIIGAVFSNGKVDPAIREAMKDRLGPIAGRAFSELEKRGRKSGIVIEVGARVFAKSLDTSPLKPPPIEPLFDRVPVQKNLIVGAMSGVASVAGVGMLVHANHRIAKKKQHSEQVSKIERAVKIGGSIIAGGGAIIAADSIILKGRGLEAVKNAHGRLVEQGLGMLRNAEGKIAMTRVGAIGVGAVAVGGALLYAINHSRQNNAPQKDDPSTWTDKLKTDPETSTGSSRTA